MLCYTNCETVELFLNGRSLRHASAYAFPRPAMSGQPGRLTGANVHPTTADLHLAWDVPCEPGVLEAVGRRAGEEICRYRVETTGAPAALRLTADRDMLAADGCDVAHLTVEVLDAEGRVVPTADTRVRFSVAGEGRLIGVDNGDPVDHDSPKADSRKAWCGLCLGIVQSGKASGDLVIEVSADGLAPARVVLTVR